MRKIIQICAIPYSKCEHTFNRSALFALCNDNTLWQIIEGEWKKLPDITQDKNYSSENKNYIPQCNECAQYHPYHLKGCTALIKCGTCGKLGNHGGFMCPTDFARAYPDD